MTFRFDDARASAINFAATQIVARYGVEPVLVADLYGRIRIAVDDRNAALPEQRLADLREHSAEIAHEFARHVGTFSPDVSGKGVFLFATDMLAPDELFRRTDILTIEVDQGQVGWVDNSVVGQYWLDAPHTQSPKNAAAKRVTFFAIKGGLGRSTAAAVWAWKLAETGKRVLILDLDLESPGLGRTLLPRDHQPDFGIVDWFVEDPVGQANDELFASMCGRSPLAKNTRGEILVVPAGGRTRENYTYLPKLGRTYVSLTRRDAAIHRESFGARLARFVTTAEKQYQPDITILDSRAGLHDIAGVLVTDLGATSLLFAHDTEQTWDAYELLFRAWRDYPERAEIFRERLHIVAAQIPEQNPREYLERFNRRSYQLFAENLYEPGAASQLSDPVEDALRDRITGDFAAFNYQEGTFEDDAPHNPLRIYWGSALQHFDPVHHAERASRPHIDALIAHFVERLGEILDVAKED